MEGTPVPEQDEVFRWKAIDLIIFSAFFLATVLFLPLAAFLLLRLFQPKLQITELSGVQQILIQALMDFLLVGFIFFLIGILHGRPILPTLRFIRRPHLPVGRLIAGGCFLAITVVLVSTLFPMPADTPIEKLLTTPFSIVVFAVFGVAFAPLLEELIFRGFVFTALVDIAGPKPGVLVTALLFAALHAYQLWGNWAAIAVIFLVGLVLTLVRQRTDSVVPSIVMHTAYNAMIFGISGLGTLLGHDTKPH
jgi:membrane protease YdiL (CAAX protease family)